MASKWPRLRDLWRKDDLTVGIEEPKKAVDIPLIPGVDEVGDGLHLLLRHRPRSISLRGGALY
jgi:hypothetical protein